MNQPLVSILIPTYRRPHYLREALSSAVAQTYQNIQIIVRDNASGDDTPAVVRSFADPRIQFHQSPVPGDARSNGDACLALAEGTYVFFICDDDRAGPNYVEVLLRALDRDPEILVAYGGTKVINENGQIIDERVPEGSFAWQAAAVLEGWRDGRLPLATGVNYFCRTAFLRKLLPQIEFPHGQNSDNAMFMTAAIKGKVYFTDECYFYYRKYPENSERFFPYQERLEADLAFLRYLDQLVASGPSLGLQENEWPRLRAHLRRLLAGHYYSVFHKYHLRKEGWRSLTRAGLLAPLRLYGARNWFYLLAKELRSQVTKEANG